MQILQHWCLLSNYFSSFHNSWLSQVLRSNRKITTRHKPVVGARPYCSTCVVHMLIFLCAVPPFTCANYMEVQINPKSARSNHKAYSVNLHSAGRLTSDLSRIQWYQLWWSEYFNNDHSTHPSQSSHNLIFDHQDDFGTNSLVIFIFDT